jgi:hypothetical protein
MVNVMKILEKTAVETASVNITVKGLRKELA